MEYWQSIFTRAEATIPVYLQYFPTLMMGSVNLSTFTGMKDALPELAQVRDTQVQAVDSARQARDFSWGALRLISLKVPSIIEGMLDESSGVLDDLHKVYAIVPWSPEKTISRCKLLIPIWEAADSWQVAQSPARPAIIRNGVGFGTFMSMVAAYFPLSQTTANVEHLLDEAREALRKSARSLETYCIRFRKAAEGLADPGSAAEVAVLGIPTTSSSQLPETLGIRTFGQGGTNGLQLLINYEPYHLEDGDIAELEWQILDTDTGFDHSTPYDASGNAIGPFLVGKTIRIRTVVTNTHGSRTGGVRQLTLIAPPV